MAWRPGGQCLLWGASAYHPSRQTGTGKRQRGPPDRVRRAGGGRKRAEEKYPGLDAAFLAILKEHTAGDPMEVNMLWTNLGDKAISARLKERGFPVGVSIVKRLLKKYHYRRRKAVKTKTFQSVPERNAQFEKIIEVGEAEYQSPNPLLSIDTKKKNILGRCIGRDRST